MTMMRAVGPVEAAGSALRGSSLPRNGSEPARPTSMRGPGDRRKEGVGDQHLENRLTEPAWTIRFSR